MASNRKRVDGPFYESETMHSGWGVATFGFNPKTIVLNYNPPLTRRQAEILVDGLNAREPWADEEFKQHRTKRFTY